MRKILTRLVIVLAIVMAGLLMLLPPASIDTAAPAPNVVRGAYHIHTDRSDGSGTVEEVAAAAARAGLQFIILTDHGDGTRPPDPPAYRRGVLTLDAVELNTTGGHYAAIGLAAAPYPLAGTPDAVIEDVRRLGGVGIATHPGSPRPSLRWTDWDAAFDGARMDQRRQRVARRGAPADHAGAAWLPAARARVDVGTAGSAKRSPRAMGSPDASRGEYLPLPAPMRTRGLGFGQRDRSRRRRLPSPLPGYEATFRTFSNHVVLDAPFSGDAAKDAAALIAALRKGRLYSVVDGLASPGGLSLTASSGSRTAMMGDDLPIEGDVIVRAAVTAPPGTTLVLLKNGERVHQVTDAGRWR